MLALVMVALVQAATPLASDSTPAARALRTLIGRAVVANRRVPDSLLAYRAQMESELAFVTRQPDGIEQTFAIEQTESTVQWTRTGTFEQRVVGYRSQSVGVTVSAVGLFRQAWAVPILYGNRITLLFGQPDSAARKVRRRSRTDTTVAVHPFADDRERVYRYSGGDTVATINLGGREIRLVRIHVEPHGEFVTRRTAAFRGDIELDVQRAQIVRMRGYFVTVGPQRRQRMRLLASQLEAIAYVELENGEYEQRYWLPTAQRVEAQASIAVMGEQRAIFRVISKFRGMTVNPPDTSRTAVASDQPLGADTLSLGKHLLTFAPRDSIDGYSGWARDIGNLTGTVHADDFTDVAPDRWRPTGRPIVRLRFQESSDLAHYNRIEGVYTGLGAELKLRDVAPGFVVRGHLGYAWGEQTVRGRASVERQQGLVWPFVRAARSLDLTNDFREPYDSGSTIGALFSIDDYDYVDRHATALGLTGFLSRRRDIRWRVEAGAGSDRYAHVTRDRGWVGSDSGFRLNRGVATGSYRQATVKLEFRPDVNAAFVRPGIGVVLQGTVATGDLHWQRAELRLVGRRSLGPVIYAAQLDAGVVSGNPIPPQQLFELGENQHLPGYGYKEFAGDQAAVLRGLVMYPLPLWRAPLRFGRWVLPGVGPALSFGAQSGWADASTRAARDAIVRLGTTNDSTLGLPGSVSGSPVSRPTDGIKSSIDFRLRFFGGAVSVGVARATDRHQPWKLVAGFAQIL